MLLQSDNIVLTKILAYCHCSVQSSQDLLLVNDPAEAFLDRYLRAILFGHDVFVEPIFGCTGK
jgi:hypothetical protein